MSRKQAVRRPTEDRALARVSREEMRLALRTALSREGISIQTAERDLDSQSERFNRIWASALAQVAK